LGCARGMVQDPFDLAFGVTGDAADALLHLSAEICCSARYAVFVHGRLLDDVM
jgi:hypothetical protein